MDEKKGTVLNNGQRKAIAVTKEQQMAALVLKAKDKLAARRAELLHVVMDEYGIGESYSMIDQYEEYLQLNKAKLRENGMEWSREGVVTRDGKVDMRLRELTGEYIQKIAELEMRRTTLVQEVWEAETTADLPELPE